MNDRGKATPLEWAIICSLILAAIGAAVFVLHDALVQAMEEAAR